MRVLVVPLPSSSPVVASHVAALMGLVRRAGHEPLLLEGPTRPPLRPARPDLAASLAWTRAYVRAQAERARAVAREARPGDVVLLFLGAHHLPAALAARRAGARILYLPGGRPSRQVSGPAALAARAMEERLMRMADLVGVESADELRALPVGVRAEPLAARGVPIPPDAELTPWTERDDVVAFVGRLEPHKGVAAFARAARRRLSIDPRFVVAGAGSLAPRLVRERGASFRGWLGEEEKLRLLGRSRLLVLPSRGEGLPTVALEAMARGTPVLALPGGGVPSLVRDGETGYHLDGASPGAILRGVRRALADPRVAEVAHAARERVAQEFSLEAAGERYRRLLAAAGRT